LKLNPSDAQAYNKRGSAYHDTGDFASAIRDFNKAIELLPTYVEAYYNRGLTYYDKGNTDIAIKDFNKALEINPRFSWAYNNLGYIFLIKQNDHEKGCHYYEQACLHGDCKLLNLVKQNGMCKEGPPKPFGEGN
jgi:tetratricopeptide (TPR) repeat protein